MTIRPYNGLSTPQLLPEADVWCSAEILTILPAVSIWPQTSNYAPESNLLSNAEPYCGNRRYSATTHRTARNTATTTSFQAYHGPTANRPLILAKDVERVKITGGGRIRMDDTYTENTVWQHYARNCSDRIHIVPIAICNARHIEISDIEINRCSNYHTIFYRADSVFIGNLRLLEVACLSGDGLSFGNAVQNVRVERAIYESNDDGGKAIALIPWGSTNPRQDYNEIDNITVTDCVLRGGHSVGTWPDNPFDGKPFDNNEVDDYSPVKNLFINTNEYLSPCDIMWVKPTTLITDCGIRGSSTIRNGDFTDRLAYWTAQGPVHADCILSRAHTVSSSTATASYGLLPPMRQNLGTISATAPEHSPSSRQEPILSELSAAMQLYEASTSSKSQIINRRT